MASVQPAQGKGLIMTMAPMQPAQGKELIMTMASVQPAQGKGLIMTMASMQQGQVVEVHILHCMYLLYSAAQVPQRLPTGDGHVNDEQ